MPIFEANQPPAVRSVPPSQRLAAASTRRRCRSSDHLNDWREHFWLRQRGSAVRQAINRSVRPNRLETAARQPRMGDAVRLWRGPPIRLERWGPRGAASARPESAGLEAHPSGRVLQLCCAQHTSSPPARPVRRRARKSENNKPDKSDRRIGGRPSILVMAF